VDGTDNLAVQGSAYGTIIDACLAQPRCKSLTTWGFTDKYSWIPGTFSGFGRGLPFDQLFGPKPAYLMLRDALARP
jgi:endo-1,4-beta-xylanase